MRSNFRVALGGAVVLAWLLAGCAGPSLRDPGPAVPTARQPALTVAFLFAPVRSDVNQELAQLDRMPRSPAEELRRAYVMLQSGAVDQASQIVREQLFGPSLPTVAVESYAWYVRALVDQRKGDASGERLARDKAARLALDEDLRRLALGQDGTQRNEQLGQPADVALGEVKLLQRTAWNALPPRPAKLDKMSPVWRLTVHHSAVYLPDTSPTVAAAQISAIQREHMQKDWGDIGYHFVIDTAGRVWACRSLAWQGAHAGDSERNRGNIGICVLGNFTRGPEGQEPTTPQLAALRSLVASLRRRYSIRPEGLLTHRELRSTSCPGERLQVVVERMRHDAVVAAPGQ